MCLIGKLPKSKNHHELIEIFLFCFLGNCESVDYCENTAYAAGEKLKYTDSRVTYHKSVYTETAEKNGDDEDCRGILEFRALNKREFVIARIEKLLLEKRYLLLRKILCVCRQELIYYISIHFKFLQINL